MRSSAPGEALARLRAHRLDFVVQTTATPGNAPEIPALVDWAAAEGAVCFNLYFLVPTGRGVDLMDLAPQRIETLLGGARGGRRAATAGR